MCVFVLKNGNAKLPLLDTYNKARKKAAKAYNDAFSVNENISNYDINRDLYLKKTKHTGHFESNINVAWSEDIITKYKEKWQWNYLIKNPQIKFNIEQLNNYKEFIPWNIFFGHGNCNWDENIIEKYKKS